MTESSVRIPWLFVLLPMAASIACFWPALGGGFVSDDYLFGVFCDHRQDGIAVRWDLVLSDFARPWLGMDGPFYRPMLSVSLAFDYTLGGGAPFVFHLTNLLLHAAVVGMAAVLCALYCPGRAALAALLGGLLCALHPIASEPVAWIAARNSGLEVFFRTGALVAFALYLKTGRRPAAAVCAALAVFALATKESAAVLPVSMLALDLLDRPRRPLRERLRLHLSFAPLWVGYFLLRLLLFGGIVGMPSAAPSLAELWSNFAGKLPMLFTPGAAAGDGITLADMAFGLACAAAVARGLARRELTLVVVLAVVWLGLHFAPTFRQQAFGGLSGGRMLYGAVPVLALCLARLLLGPPPARGLLERWGGPAVLATAALAVLPVTRTQLAHYEAAWREMAAAADGLGRVAAAARDPRPLAITNMPLNVPGVPPFNPNGWFPLGQQPFQPSDLPMVSLGFMTVEVPLGEVLYHDASPLRAIDRAGAPIASWDDKAQIFRLRKRPPDPVLPPLRAAPGDPRRWEFGSPVPADWIEQVEIRVAGDPGAGGTLIWTWTWQTSKDDLVQAPLRQQAFGPGVPGEGGADTVITIDLSHHIGLVVPLATIDLAVSGFSVSFDTAAPVRVSSMRAADRLPVLPLGGPPLAGRNVPLDRLADLLDARLAPLLRGDGASQDGPALRLVLLGPHSGLPVPLTRGEALRLPAAITGNMRTISRFARRNPYYYFVEAIAPPGRPGSARSELDWFELEVE